jgi:hypothetical protein
MEVQAMLNNTKHKIQTSDLHELIDDQFVTRLQVEEKTAANTPLRNHKEGAKRSHRRHRLYAWNTGVTKSGWRVSTW